MDSNKKVMLFYRRAYKLVIVTIEPNAFENICEHFEQKWYNV